MPEFCGSSLCAHRFAAWRDMWNDDRVVDPCEQCVGVLVALLGFPPDTPRTLAGLRGALLDAAGVTTS